jgi:hypothetical protein
VSLTRALAQEGLCPVLCCGYLAAQIHTRVRIGGESGMPKPNARLDAARRAYREALEAARASPTPEAWAKLLAAGKELSHAEDPRSRGRRGRRRPSEPAAPAPERSEALAEPGEGAEDR